MFAGNVYAEFSTSTGSDLPVGTLPSEETELPINQGGDNQPCLENQRPNHTACATQLIFPVQLLRIENSAVNDVKRGFRRYCRTRRREIQGLL